MPESLALSPRLAPGLTALWQSENSQSLTQGRGYAHPAAVPPGAVLFVGLATSYNQTQNVNGDPAAPLVFDVTDNPGAFYRREMDFLAAVSPRLPYGHLDVLYQRESDPKVLQAALYDDGPGAAFGTAQLQLTHDLLTHLTHLPPDQRPRALVVANRLAQELLGYFHNDATPTARPWLGLTFTEQPGLPDEEPFYRCEAWGMVPVLFTVPFSGLSERYNTPDKKAKKHARLAATLKRLL